MLFSQVTLLLISLSIRNVAYAQQGRDPYVPTQANCTADVRVRQADEGLSQAEQEWRRRRLESVIDSLKSYLPRANLSGFNVTQYLSKLNATNAPVVGLAISGGGTQSGIGGLGLWQAFDARYPPAVEAGTGGLTQCISYLTGLSGGGFLTVSTLASNNFTSIERLREAINFTQDYLVGPTGNETEYFAELFENAGAKAEANYSVSVVDIFGQQFGQYLPKEWRYRSYSDISGLNHSFSLGTGPMPIIALAEVIPGRSPNIGGILYPGNNATNGFNLTSYEITPFEFGSWLGGRIQAFMPTKWLGTSMSRGRPQANDSCVEGFDKFTFIQGSTANAFNFWFIDDWYNIPLFAKRSLQAFGLLRRQSSSGQIVIPENQADSPLVQLVNSTAAEFDQTFNESLWATYPNPFQGYNAAMSGVEELLLVDGSETGETIPLRPLIIPEREVDFIIAYDATSDSENSWVNGTNFINTAISASEGGIPFPRVPSSRTMVNLNITRFPTFFGCNRTSEPGSRFPLVLYLPNTAWTQYSNYSYMQSTFTDNQFDLVMNNSFNAATYGNGTIDKTWPACLACAVIKKSVIREGLQLPDVCKTCFQRHCWNGLEDDSIVEQALRNQTPILDPGLSFTEWNKTWYAE